MITKNKFYLTVAVLISLGVLLFLFLIQPVYQDIKAGSEELVSTKQELASLESKINNIIDFKENYTEIKKISL